MDIVAAVREAVGPNVGIMVEFHGRLSAGCASAMIRRLERLSPTWCEEPVVPECIELLAEVKRQSRSPIAAGASTLRPRVAAQTEVVSLLASSSGKRPHRCHV